MRHQYLFILPVLVLAGIGCNAGPDYVRPRLTVADDFTRWPSTQPLDSAGGKTTVSTQASPLTDLAHWWEALHDPELNRLLTRAVQNNYDLQIAVDRLQEARAQLAMATGEALPTVSISGVLGGGTGNNVSRGGQVDGPLAPAVNTSGLREVTQILGADTTVQLDLFGTLRRQEQAILADTAAAQEVRNQTIITLLAQVTRDYVEIRTLQMRVAIARQTVETQRHAAQVEHERFNRGITNALDATLADRELQTTEAALPPIEAKLLMAKRNLAILLGESPDSLLQELSDSVALPRPPAEVVTGLPVDLLRRRPDVRQAEARLIAANARLGVATSYLYPRVFLSASGGFESQGLGREPVAVKGIWDIGPALVWPVLDFGSVDANIQAQNQATRARLAEFRKTVISAIGEVDNGLTMYDAQRRQLEYLRGAVESAQVALRLATERYDRGIIDYLNVLDAQRALYALQDQQAQSESAAVGAFIDVCQSLGGGWEGFAPPPPLKAPLPAVLAAVRDASGHSDRPISRD